MALSVVPASKDGGQQPQLSLDRPEAQKEHQASHAIGQGRQTLVEELRALRVTQKDAGAGEYAEREGPSEILQLLVEIGAQDPIELGARLGISAGLGVEKSQDHTHAQVRILAGVVLETRDGLVELSAHEQKDALLDDHDPLHGRSLHPLRNALRFRQELLGFLEAAAQQGARDADPDHTRLSQGLTHDLDQACERLELAINRDPVAEDHEIYDDVDPTRPHELVVADRLGHLEHLLRYGETLPGVAQGVGQEVEHVEHVRQRRSISHAPGHLHRLQRELLRLGATDPEARHQRE